MYPWTIGAEECAKFVKRALELGINFFDTADVYSHGESEILLGQALKDVPRSHIVVATKLYFGDNTPNHSGLSRKHIFEACEASLKRLQMDYIDLYQIHRWDYETPIEETMCALNDLVRSGKVHYIGASSMYAWQFAKAQHIAEVNGWTKFISMQNHYNALYREEEREMNPLCVDQGVGLLPWSPLASGWLTGTRKEGAEKTARVEGQPQTYYGHFECDAQILAEVEAVAQKLGKKSGHVALAWLLSKPGVVAPIVGLTKLHHLEEAVEALEVKLSEEDIKQIEAKYQPKPYIGQLEPEHQQPFRDFISKSVENYLKATGKKHL